MTERKDLYECSETHPGCLALREASSARGVINQDNLPFMFNPVGATTAVLLVHGFTASPWEMRLFAEHLAKERVASLAICLPGHGTSPEDLAKRCWEEWFETVTEGHQVLRSEFDSIYIAGMSTGCLLGLVLATRQPLSGLLLFSPYLRLQHWLAPFSGWLYRLHPYHPSHDTEPSPYYYNRRPVAGVHQINRLIGHVKNSLREIGCPVLAFSGDADQTVDIASAQELVNALGSTVKTYRRLSPNVPHILTREENPQREEMFREVSRFIREREETTSKPQ